MWVPLHLHSQYSILDGACSIDSIAAAAARMKMCACALTDHGNLHGAIDFYKACTAVGIKPIIGCEFYVAPTSRFEKKKVGAKSAYHLGLLAKNEVGYRHLSILSSLGFLEGFYYHPRIDRELLVKYKEGLICLSGCLSGEVATCALSNNRELFFETIRWYRDLFGQDYYLEMQRHQMSATELATIEDVAFTSTYQDLIEKQQKVNQLILEAADQFKIKCVATNDTHYMEKSDWLAHEILINIQSGEPIEIWQKDSMGEPICRVSNPKRRLYGTRECYFKSPEQMAELFVDLPEAIHTTLEVADKCNVKIDFSTKHYPQYIPKSLQAREWQPHEQADEVKKTLTELAKQGIPKRYTEEKLRKIKEKYPDKDPMQLVFQRLEYELGVIIPKGMADYLLIVWDIIHWAKNEKIAVGPGRGSGVGSIILYLIGVTDIEPLGLSLFFERFINPERLSYPDIDVDICMEGRARVFDYVVQKYGKESVAQIITFGTIKARSAIRDVGRVLSVPLSKVNTIAKLVPEEIGVTLAEAKSQDPDLFALSEQDADAAKILQFGMALEGSVRSAGTHAAGIIISPGPLVDYLPICLAKDSESIATQYSMKPVELIGMLKIDLLGLKTLTCIQMALTAIWKQHSLEIDGSNLPLDNEKTYQMLQTGKTLGIFQLESTGMQELTRNLKPDRFEDIIAIGSLYRPGPMEMIPSFINRKHGREAIEYDSPLLEPILNETYGVMVYQEQVMQIAVDLGGYSLGEGDVLRRAMGKKDRAQMEKEREKFCAGALKRGIDSAVASKIFDKMEKFAAYGFNKSHAAAYAYLTYATAYLKAHFPKIWLAALMTCDRDDTSKIAKWMREAKSLGVQLLSPDVNESEATFVAKQEGIRFAINGIKGVGEGAVEAILSERSARGPFHSFYNFFERVDLKRVGKKTIEHLVFAGSFDWTLWPRESLVESIEAMYEHVMAQQKEKEKGILTFFSLLGDEEQKSHFCTAPQVVKVLSKEELYRQEKELLGFYLTGHPLEKYCQTKRFGTRPLSDVESVKDRSVLRLACIIESMQVKYVTKTQRKFAILTISDGIETYEMLIFSDLFESKGHLLQENRLLLAVVTVDKREETPRLVATWVEDLTQAGDSTIRECDAAFDRAKQPKSYYRNNQGGQIATHKVQNEQSEALPLYSISIDLSVFQMSSVLKLKPLLSDNGGTHFLCLKFFYLGKHSYSLFVDKRYKVTVNEEWLKVLHLLPGIIIS